MYRLSEVEIINKDGQKTDLNLYRKKLGAYGPFWKHNQDFECMKVIMLRWRILCMWLVCLFKTYQSWSCLMIRHWSPSPQDLCSNVYNTTRQLNNSSVVC